MFLRYDLNDIFPTPELWTRAVRSLSPTVDLGGVPALRKLWQLVDLIMNTSGWTWSDTTGVTVSPATQGAWDDFVKQYPDAEQFENKGWPFHELMAPVMPNKAKGGHVFRPASVAARSSSPDWDESRFNQPEDDDHLAGSMNGAGEGSEDFRGNAGSAGDDDEEEEEEEDKGDDSDSSPAPSKQSGQRRAAQPAPAQSIQKKPRLTPAAQGLLSLTKSAERFNEIFGDLRDFLVAPASAPAPANSSAATSTSTATVASTSTATTTRAFQTSPQRRVSAVHQVQDAETWLEPRQRLAFIQILKKDTDTADVYMALETDELRIPFVLDELRNVGVFAFHPEYSDLNMF
ncbi:Myb-DNA-bind-3 domain-containing protein [Mycena venus]|uniref:Myb-DNA-bind-3 domain-containing protein n=1 Tax=Mycena venus TaxID=2733690 RepID=A0A8H7CKT4_9AGAR|nr:Myb-DNA-bind-3 domain-containing protein [Mycena venus]